MTPGDAESAGRKLARRGAAFNDVAGPFWSRRDDAGWRHAALAEPRHVNNQGVVHGRLLLTFADHAVSLTVWEHVGRQACSTIQLNMQFIDAARPGDFIEAAVTIIRATRSVVFVRGSLTVDTRPVASMDRI